MSMNHQMLALRLRFAMRELELVAERDDTDREPAMALLRVAVDNAIEGLLT